MTSRVVFFGALLVVGACFGSISPIAAFTAKPAGLSSATTPMAEPVAARSRTVVRNRSFVRGSNVVRSRTVVRTNRAFVGRGVARPYRAWGRRPYYGLLIGGVALGTIYAVSSIPAAPSDDVCWYWANRSQTRGYWDYC